MKNLKRAQLIAYKESISSGGVNAALAVYAELDSEGYRYAGWAFGVAAGNTITGQSALNFLSGTAMMGLGGDACRNLTQSQVDDIRIDMALGYIDTLIENGENEGIINRDVTFIETSAFHKAALEKNGLALANWTLSVPMEIIRRQQGEQAVENLWKQTRDTGGVGFYALFSSLKLAEAVKGAASSSDVDLRQMALEWIDQVPGWENFNQVARFINVFSKSLIAELEGLGNVITQLTNQLLLTAKNWVPPRDPLVLDLDGDGIEAIGIDPSRPILFDHDGDGTRNATGWIGSDDGLLVLDRNGNGLIDSGRELFGDQTLRDKPAADGSTTFANGYEALAAQDAITNKKRSAISSTLIRLHQTRIQMDDKLIRLAPRVNVTA